MIADYMFWLCGGSEHSVSKLIKLYWQVKADAPAREDGCAKDHGKRELWVNQSDRCCPVALHLFIMK
jgi:hypothetical protein